ncbi:MAG: OmpH family outer membrane protein [Candidatus Delongbacteria bacterium]|nr:OmpH family outer membrane protein [Candidatus Delongbacteria bacterium]
MKKLLLICCLVMLSAGAVTARDLKIGIVDSQAILANYEEYKNAMSILQEEKIGWDRQIIDLEQSIQRAQEEYQTQSSMMTEDWKRQKEAAIEQMLNQYQSQQMEVYNEENGLLLQRHTQLINPIIDKINEGIAKVAQEGGYDLILDNSASSMSVIVYLSDDAQDVNLSERVLEVLRETN